MAATPRTLTPRELNRALLARQLLLERASATLPRALERVGGIQAQSAASMYVGLWSRVDGLAREDLTCALERRTIVQGTLMRATIHLVSARDFWPLALAVERPRRDWWTRVQGDSSSPRAMAAAARRLRTRLAEGPLRRAEMEDLLGRDVARGIGMWIPLVRVPPSGTWERRRADLFGDAETWLGPPKVTLDDARDHLVHRYLGAFGPVSRADVATWAGLPPTTVAPILARLSLRRFRSEAGEELLDLRRAPLPNPETPAPVRFLPPWDATLLTHVRRTGILPEEYRPRIFNTKMPRSVGTFLVDGSVAGAWRHEDGHVKLKPFRRIDRGTRRELDEESERLAAFHA